MNLPVVSIIVPIRNESRYIERCIDAILAQDYPSNKVEILIVDGMSSDDTRDVIGRYLRANGNLTILDNPGLIVPKGMNIALGRVKGEIIIRVDGHCEIAADYVSKCVSYLNNSSIAGVGGPMESIGETALSGTIALAMSSRFGVGNSAFRTTSGKSMFVDTIPFAAYPRTIIGQVGLYDEELIRNQDDEYNYRIRQAGGRLLLAADIHSKYYSRGDFTKLWKQFYQYGFYKIRVLQKHPRQMSLRQFIPVVLVLAIFISSLLTALTSWGYLSLISLLLTYLCVSVITAISIKQRSPKTSILDLVLAFSIIHVAYGLGFLIGGFHFWNRWRDKG
jgi:succinoglycan biosynthesis protein ExoA